MPRLMGPPLIGPPLVSEDQSRRVNRLAHSAVGISPGLEKHQWESYAICPSEVHGGYTGRLKIALGLGKRTEDLN